MQGVWTLCWVAEKRDSIFQAAAPAGGPREDAAEDPGGLHPPWEQPRSYREAPYVKLALRLGGIYRAEPGLKWYLKRTHWYRQVTGECAPKKEKHRCQGLGKTDWFKACA